MKYMLDTDICIDLIRRKPPALLARIQAAAIGDIGVSSVTVAELSYGAHRSQQPQQNQQALEQFLLPLLIVDFDYAAALVYGQIRADLERRDTPIGSLDTLIAAHALSLGATLVTRNTDEFQRVSQLAVADWSQAAPQP
jgi:tRNA(fMet)-specific endonuclease VapC